MFEKTSVQPTEYYSEVRAHYFPLAGNRHNILDFSIISFPTSSNKIIF